MKNLLRAKGVTTPIICLMCSEDIKHLLHLFFDCKYATELWPKVGLQFAMQEIESAPDWMLSELSRGNAVTNEKISMVLWSIWFARNKRVWENK